MTPLEVVREIIVDCERDVANMDGKPLTGINVAQWFAETLAMVSALAKVVEILLAHQHEFNPTAPVGYDRDIVTYPLTGPMQVHT